MRTLSIAFVFLFLLSCNSDSGSSYKNNSSSTYEETKQSLADRERENPTDFISATGTYRQNLVDRWVLEGTISNKASVAAYKDVVLRITYYSKTETEIGSENKTLYEYYPPGSSKKFKIKVDGYQETASVGFNVVSASTAN